MNNDKSPWEDGLTQEFYEKFDEYLKDELQEIMINILLTIVLVYIAK